MTAHVGRYRAYPAYKPSGVEWLGDIPEGWDTMKLSYAVKLQSGDTITSQAIKETGDFAVYGGNGRRGYTSKFNCDGQFVLIGRQGALCGNINVAEGKFFASEHAIVVHPRQPFAIRYLAEFLWFMNLGQYSVAAAQPGVSVERLNDLGIVKTPLPEQTIIAAFLDHETAKIDALIAKQERLIALLEEKRQAVISHAVTKGLNPTAPLRPSGIDWLGDVPAHWEVVKGKHLFELITSGSRGWADYYSDEGALFFRIANLTRDTISPKLLSIQNVTPPRGTEGERSKIRVGDLLVSITADLGSVCVADEHVENGYVSQHVALCRPQAEIASSDWLGFCILSDSCKSQLLESGYGGTKIQLSLPDIRELNIVKPPAAEQLEIADFLNKKLELFAKGWEVASQQITLLKERRTALISAAVTGKIDVRDWQAPAVISTQDISQDA